MVYSFEPSFNRKVTQTDLGFCSIPQLHASRILDVHDIVFIVDGYWSVRLENEEIAVNAGDVFVLPAAMRHYGTQTCKRKTRLIYIHYTKEKGDHQLVKNDELDKGFVIQTHTCNCIHLYHYFKEILKLNWSQTDHKEFRCSALLSLLVSSLHDIYKQSRIKHDQIIIDLLSIFNEEKQRFFSIPELADKANISPRSLEYRFKAETGLSAHKYQMNAKLDQIANLLSSEFNTSLKNLAVNFGFTDEFHLSSAFKKRFGVSPRQYKKN
jgi:AraC-like DNA-binding protein